MNIKRTTNQRQLKLIVSFMVENPHWTFNKKIKENMEEWNNLVKHLNSLGPPTKDALIWKKVWTDYKCNVKKKLIHNENVLATGAGEFKLLTGLDNSVVKLLNLDNTKNNEVNALDLNFSDDESDCAPTLKSSTISNHGKSPAYASSAFEEGGASPLNVSSDESASVYTVSHNASPPPITTKTAKKQLIKRQLMIQEDLCIEVNKSLNRIEKHLNEYKNYKRGRYKLDKYRLKLYKRKLEKTEQQRLEGNKIRMAALDVKKRKLEMQELKMKMLFDLKNCVKK